MRRCEPQTRVEQKEEKLRGVRSLHRGDAYPNTSTNSRDGGLVVQEECGKRDGLSPGPGQLTVLSVRQAVRPPEEIPV